MCTRLPRQACWRRGRLDEIRPTGYDATVNTGLNGLLDRDVLRAIPVPSRKLKGIIHSEAVNLTFSYVNYRERKMQPM